MKGLVLLSLGLAILVGCGPKEDATANAAPPPGPNAVAPPAQPNASKLSPASGMGGIGPAGSKPTETKTTG